MDTVKDMVIDKAVDGILGILANKSIEELKEFVNKNKRQKILLGCIKEIKNENSDNKNLEVNILSEEILNIGDEKISPDLSIEELKLNLNPLIEKCLKTDDEELFKEVSTKICESYMKKSRLSIELYHLLKKEEKNFEMIDKKLEMLKNISEEPPQLIHFIDELDDCKMFCYIYLWVSQEIEEEILYELEENTFGVETKNYKVDGLYYLDINFVEPISQKDLKDYLTELNKVFSRYNIGVYGVYSHN